MKRLRKKWKGMGDRGHILSLVLLLLIFYSILKYYWGSYCIRFVVCCIKYYCLCLIFGILIVLLWYLFTCGKEKECCIINEEFLIEDTADLSLGLKDTIDYIYNLIGLNRIYTIGIIGKYGSGKTTVIENLKNKYKEEGNKGYVFIDLNVWEYPTIEALIQGIANSVSFRMNDPILKDLFNSWARDLNISINIYGIQSNIILNRLPTIEFRRRLYKRLEELNKTIVFILDDIDRMLDSNSIVNVFKIYQWFFPMKNNKLIKIIFLLNYERTTKIIQQIPYCYEDIKDGKPTVEKQEEPFISKFIDVQVSVPYPDYIRITNSIKTFITEYTTKVKIPIDNEEKIKKNLIVLISSFTLREFNNFIKQLHYIKEMPAIYHYPSLIVYYYFYIKYPEFIYIIKKLMSTLSFSKHLKFVLSSSNSVRMYYEFAYKLNSTEKELLYNNTPIANSVYKSLKNEKYISKEKYIEEYVNEFNQLSSVSIYFNVQSIIPMFNNFRLFENFINNSFNTVKEKYKEIIEKLSWENDEKINIQEVQALLRLAVEEYQIYYDEYYLLTSKNWKALVLFLFSSYLYDLLNEERYIFFADKNKIEEESNSIISAQQFTYFLKYIVDIVQIKNFTGYVLENKNKMNPILLYSNIYNLSMLKDENVKEYYYLMGKIINVKDRIIFGWHIFDWDSSDRVICLPLWMIYLYYKYYETGGDQEWYKEYISKMNDFKSIISNINKEVLKRQVEQIKQVSNNEVFIDMNVYTQHSKEEIIVIFNILLSEIIFKFLKKNKYESILIKVNGNRAISNYIEDNKCLKKLIYLKTSIDELRLFKLIIDSK